MYDFLQDDDNVKLKYKISSLIDNQLPSFIQEEGTVFAEFLKKYYEWMESHELTITDITQNEYRFLLQTEGDTLLLEDGYTLTLENDRNNVSAYEKNEIVVGQSSGAVGTVDRNTNTSSSKIYVTNTTKKDFIPDELIIGSNNRTIAKVSSFLKNPLYASRTLLKSRDVDSTTTTYIDNFTNEFLNNIPDDLSADKSLIIKHIVDVYRAKGSSASYDFLFKTLYDIQDLTVYYPKTDLLKPSSGRWLKEQSLRIITTDPIENFSSRRVTGQSSGATGIVDRIEKFAAGVLQITELFLTDIEGNFVVGETVTSTEVDGISGSGYAQGILTNINIVGPGTDYKVGDTITITGGGGTEAAARVSQVGAGALTSFTVFDGGDGFVSGIDVTVNNFGTGGTGFAGRIKSVAESFTFSINEDQINDFTQVSLNDTEYGLSGNTESNVSDRLIDSLGFSKFDAGVITEVSTTNIGAGYDAIPQIFVTEPRSFVFRDDAVRILNLNADPDSLGTTNAITGTFSSLERITSNNGNKVGTFYGLVFTDETIGDPTRMRAKNIVYLGTVGVGRNDLVSLNENCVNSAFPTVYDVQIVQTGEEIVNSFKFRRGIDASDASDSGPSSTRVNYITNTKAIDMTGGDQKLKFPIDSITLSGTTATVTAYGKHGFSDEESGLKVIITGADESGFNGEFLITVDSTTTFTFNVTRTATDITRSDTTATVTLNSNNNGLTTGTDITINDLTYSDYNGTYTITKIANNQFTFTCAGTENDYEDVEIDIVPDSLSATAQHTTTLSTLEAVGTTVTATVASGNTTEYLSNGTSITVADAVDTNYNGTFTVNDVLSETQFTYIVDTAPSDTEETGTFTLTSTEALKYDENVAVRFGLPFGHTSGDRYLMSSVDFDSNELITGFTTGSTAVVNTGVAYTTGGSLGNNSIVGVSANGAGTGSIKEIEITNFGVGFTSSPILSISDFGGGDAVLTANIGTIGNTVGKYLDENGFLSSNKKIIDSNFYQDYSYSLIANKQLNEYEKIVKKLFHTAGTKLFGEYRPISEELQMGFDHLLVYEDGGEILLEDTGDNILIEQYFDPSHSITLTNNQDIDDYGSGGTVTIAGNSLSIIGTGTNFSNDYDAGSMIILDNEQAFTVSYGELKLENYLSGSINIDSQNVITRFVISNTTSNFSSSSIVTQVSSSTDKVVSGIVLRHELDFQNNNILLIHSCNGIFDTNSNINSGSIVTSSKLITEGIEVKTTVVSYKMIIEDSESDRLILEDSSNFIYENQKTRIRNEKIDIYNIALEDGDNLILQNSKYSNTGTRITASVTEAKTNVILGNDTDFQKDFRINDVIQIQTTKESAKILEIINSSCMIANTVISSDNDYNLKIVYSESDFVPGDLLLEDDSGSTLVLNTRVPNSSKIDNYSKEYYLILEQSVRGTTSANGLNDGNTTLLSTDSFYEEDLLVNDIISLSSSTLKAQVTSITVRTGLGLEYTSDCFILEDGYKFLTEDSIRIDQITVNTAIGNGASNQTFTLYTTRNLDLEKNPELIYITVPYDGSNNHMRFDQANGNFGQILLEDGIGLSNSGYIGTSSTEGKFLFELNTEYNNQISKLVTS